MSKVKHSIIIGALTSTFGIFLAKLIGLFYVAPFSLLATEANMVYYSNAYTLYDVILNVSAAGIPFAVSSLIAKYYEEKNYKTVLLINRLSSIILLVSGIIFGIVFALAAKIVAGSILGDDAPINDIVYQSRTFIILSLSIMTVPYLTGIRGLFQGLKELSVYSFTQVLEQFIRIIFLLGIGYLYVVVFKYDTIYAIYIGVLSAFVSAFFTIVYLWKSSRKKLREINELAVNQTVDVEEPKFIFKAIMALGIPYLLAVFFGSASNVINSSMFLPIIEKFTEVNYEDAKLMLGIVQFNALKLVTIPQVLALGFSASIVPYITISLAKKDYSTLKENIIDIYEIILYITFYLSLMLFVFARPIYSLMYGNTNLDLGSDVLMTSSILAFVGTIAPVSSTILMTAKLKNQVVYYLIITTIIKLITFIPLVIYFSYQGMIISTVIASGIYVLLCLYSLRKKYHIRYQELMKKIIGMLVSLIITYFTIAILSNFIKFDYDSKMMIIIVLAIYGVISLLVYLLVSSYFKIPQEIYRKANITK